MISLFQSQCKEAEESSRANSDWDMVEIDNTNGNQLQEIKVEHDQATNPRGITIISDNEVHETKHKMSYAPHAPIRTMKITRSSSLAKKMMSRKDTITVNHKVQMKKTQQVRRHRKNIQLRR